MRNDKHIRKAEKAVRIELLKHQQIIQNTHCEPCPKRSANSVTECEGCSHFENLLAIGESLNRIKSNPQLAVDTVRKLNGIREGNPVVSKVAVEEKKQELTIEVYNDLKAQGKSDRFIMGAYNIYPNKLNKFKRDNGLIKDEPKKFIAEAKTDTLPQSAWNIALESENELLKQKNAELYEANETFKDGILSREKEIGELKLKIESYKSHITKLRAVEEDYHKLIRDYDETKEQNHRLKHAEPLLLDVMKLYIGLREQVDYMAEKGRLA